MAAILPHQVPLGKWDLPKCAHRAHISMHKDSIPFSLTPRARGAKPGAGIVLSRRGFAPKSGPPGVPLTDAKPLDPRPPSEGEFCISFARQRLLVIGFPLSAIGCQDLGFGIGDWGLGIGD